MVSDETYWINDKRGDLDDQYFQINDVKCGTEDVDVCKIAKDVEQLKNQ